MSPIFNFSALLQKYRITTHKKCIIFTDQPKPKNFISQCKKSKILDISMVHYTCHNLIPNCNRLGSAILVESDLQDILQVIDKIKPTMILICFSNKNSFALRYLVDICQQKEIGIKKIILEKNHLKNKKKFRLKKIEPEELWGRKSLSLDNYSIRQMVKDKVVMLTGAGGSIGSEIARQISKYKPGLLIFFEITELFLYNLELEFQTDFPDVHFTSILGSVQDKKRIEWVIKKYKPDVIFHAAAYKHVPMMEKNPIGAVRNNIKGSWQLANIALKYNIARFVLISTDKAVNPINVMGASKRVCELICQYLQMQTKQTKFLAVRFGNVLGSSGSVVQRFKEQIEKGGPITVTHPDMRRYFMSISEACQLVMQAGAIGNGGEIFILDMEEPIKIMKLAEQMIVLAGYMPHKDIEIMFTGLRPGEKIYEELLTDVEATMATTYPGVRIAKMTAAPHDLEKKLAHVFNLSQDSSTTLVKEALKDLVPEFQPSLETSSWDKKDLRVIHGKLKLIR